MRQAPYFWTTSSCWLCCFRSIQLASLLLRTWNTFVWHLLCTANRHWVPLDQQDWYKCSKATQKTVKHKSVQQQYLESGSSSHHHSITKLMLTTAWSFITTLHLVATNSPWSINCSQLALPIRNLCFHASSLPCLHTFRHAIPTSLMFLFFLFSCIYI